jgi:protein-disulfide isomerase
MSGTSGGRRMRVDRRGWAPAWLLSGLLALSAAAIPVGAQAAEPDLPAEQVEQIVRDLLLREPEIILQALEELQRREAAEQAQRQQESIVANQEALVSDPASPVGGNPEGDVTLVEFFDYRCTYCRRVVSSVQALMQEDRELRIVFKELPVLGEDSVRAARAALAAERQGHYTPFHFALMTSEDLSPDAIRRLAAEVGLDPDQLEQDMDAPEIQEAIDANYRLAQELGIEGTPAFVVGDELIPGAVDKGRLESLIANARAG